MEYQKKFILIKNYNYNNHKLACKNEQPGAEKIFLWCFDSLVKKEIRISNKESI